LEILDGRTNVFYRLGVPRAHKTGFVARIGADEVGRLPVSSDVACTEIKRPHALEGGRRGGCLPATSGGRTLGASAWLSTEACPNAEPLPTAEQRPSGSGCPPSLRPVAEQLGIDFPGNGQQRGQSQGNEDSVSYHQGSSIDLSSTMVLVYQSPET